MNEEPTPEKKRFDSEKLHRAVEDSFDSQPDAQEIPESRPRRRADGFKLEISELDDESESMDEHEKREELLQTFSERRFHAAIRLVCSLFVFALLTWFETAAVNGYLLPVYVSLHGHTFGFLAADTGLLLIAALLCLPELLSGAAAFFKFKPKPGSMVFLAFFGALCNDLRLLVQPGSFVKGSMEIYSACAAAVIAFHLFARVLDYTRVMHSIRAVPENGDFYSLKTVDLSAFLQKTDSEEETLLCPVRSFHLEDFSQHAFAASPAGRAARIFAPVFFVAALTAGGISVAMGRSAAGAAASFAALCCIASPFLFEFSLMLPFTRTSRKLRKRKALIGGFADVERLWSADGVITDAGMLFPPDTVAVHGIKTFSGVKVGKAVLDAASLTFAAGAPLTQSFLNLIQEESHESLETVTELQYQDDLGLRAMIGGREVLLGNRDLMRTHGVQTPSREYEAKYVAEGRDIFYLATGGQLNALFIAGYYSSRGILSSLKKLERAGFSLFVKTTDANITPSLIAERLGEDYSDVRFLNDSQAKRLYAAAELSGDDAGIAFSGSMGALTDAITAGSKLRGTFRASVSVQLAGALLGALIVLWCSLTTGVRVLTPVTLLTYQGIWAVPPLLMGLFRRH